MIRRVSFNDLNKCVDVIKQGFLPVAKEFKITEEQSPNYIAFAINPDKLINQYNNGRDMYVYTVDEQIVGYFSLEFFGNECELCNLCVIPEYQHMGIGSALLKYAISLAARQSLSKIKLSIVDENTSLKKWYSSFGFVHTHTVKYDFFSFNCGYMELKL